MSQQQLRTVGFSGDLQHPGRRSLEDGRRWAFLCFSNSLLGNIIGRLISTDGFLVGLIQGVEQRENSLLIPDGGSMCSSDEMPFSVELLVRSGAHDPSLSAFRETGDRSFRNKSRMPKLRLSESFTQRSNVCGSSLPDFMSSRRCTLVSISVPFRILCSCLLNN